MAAVRKYGKVVGTFLLLELSLPLFALDSTRTLTQYVHRIWQNQQGLTVGATAGILQTRDGYLWLATQGGLTRFDGVQFSPVEGVYPGAPASAWTRNLAEDATGTLWAGTNDNGLYRMNADRTTHFSIEQGLPGNSIQCLLSARDGAMWVCTENGLAMIDSRSDKIQTFHVSQGLANDNVRAACQDSSGSLWIGGDGILLSVWDGAKFTLRTLKGIPMTSSVRALACVGNDIWVGTADGLIRLSGDEQRLYTMANHLAANFVFSIASGTD